MKQFKSFETERLLLRPTDEQDAEFVLELVNSPKWKQFIGDRKVKNIEEAKNYISIKMLPQLLRLGYGNYTVIRKSDGTKIGSCGFYDREGIEGVDIGFAFLPAFEGKGYAYESANKIKVVGVSEFGIQKIAAITTKENLSSQKLIEKLGLVYIKMIKIPNDDEELMYYEWGV